MTMQSGEKNARQAMVLYLRPRVDAVFNLYQGRFGIYLCWQMYKCWLHQPTFVSLQNRKMPNISTTSEKYRNTDIVIAVVVVFIFIAIAINIAAVTSPYSTRDLGKALVS